MQAQFERIKELENKMKGKYLTEEWLGKVLEAVFLGYEWIHDEKFQAGGETYNFRPDYCCHELQTCVEFDGPDHFTKANVIQADIKKNQIIKYSGYDIIRIPYFVQLNSAGIKYFFNLNIDYNFNYDFKHGFISKNVTLPANFCEQGIWKFKEFITDLKINEDNPQAAQEILSEIKESLKVKLNSSKLPHEKALLNVVPSNLFSCLEFSTRNHDSLENANITLNNLKTHWNCIILESSLTLADQAGVYNLNYKYNSDGNLAGYSFMWLYESKIYKYTFLLEKDLEDENEVIVNVYLNEKYLKYRKTLEISSINVFNILDILFSAFKDE